MCRVKADYLLMLRVEVIPLTMLGFPPRNNQHGSAESNFSRKQERGTATPGPPPSPEVKQRKHGASRKLVPAKRADTQLTSVLTSMCCRLQAAGRTPSHVYGAEHLLRLFVKLPEMYPAASVGKEQVSTAAWRVL